MSNHPNKEPSKLNGNFNQAAGNVKQTAGKILNNSKLQAEGAAQATDGKTEKTMAGIKEKVKNGTHVAGDTIERVGDKITQAGLPKVGAAVRKAGDKLEHSAD